MSEFRKLVRFDKRDTEGNVLRDTKKSLKRGLFVYNWYIS